MNRYHVWMEGYLVTGMEGIPAKATYYGEFNGKDFADAALQCCSLNFADMSLFKVGNDGVPSYWGCRLFDNEEDARRSFG